MAISTNAFLIDSPNEFEKAALEIFQFQALHNPVYKKYLELLKCNPESVTSTSQIPFLPVEFYKTHEVRARSQEERVKTKTFSSSGTSGQEVSKHFVEDISVYEKSFRKGFELFYGPVKDFCVLALLPSYLEREGSSLVYMMDTLIKDSGHPQSGFYLHNHDQLFNVLTELKAAGNKTILIGVTYALLDFAESHPIDFPQLIVMETGGMKGKREEMIRADVHEKLKKGFGVSHIHSEYGMTELLSQAYSKGDGIFQTPPWMKIIIHQQHDLFSEAGEGQTGVISVIDLANIYSCSFITTQDVGRKHADGSFEVLGRTDFSDVRGCNLMIS
ncbi:MAG: acyl transferase [Bacteroidetes bacterium]|nr:acyl transferase [Bacteroidota bacterium]